MVQEQRHIIRRQLIELSLPQEEGAYAIQREASRLFQEHVVPELGRLLDTLSPEEDHLTISRLEIDLGGIPINEWGSIFIARCLEALQRQLPEKKHAIQQGDKAVGEIQTAEVVWLRQLLFFLQTGRLETTSMQSALSEGKQPTPVLSMAKEDIEKVFLQALDKAPGLWRSLLRQLLETSPPNVRRLVWQFPPSFVMALLSKVYSFNFQPFAQRFQQMSLSARERVIHEIIQRYRSPNPNLESALAEWLESAFSGREDPPQSTAPDHAGAKLLEPDADRKWYSKSEKEKPPSEGGKSEEQAFFIENSGLVLLYPFLERFLDACSLTEEGDFISQDTRHVAIHLLQHLCTGEETHFEFSLVLNKLLCNMPLEDPLRRDELLSEAMKGEADQLLQAVIGHWTVLKNTTTDGLRETFLKRRGKLSPLSGSMDWRLQIEPKGVDVLLDWLPWGYGYIKLPWMSGAIHVEWRFN